MVDVTQEDRLLVADILDEVSDLLDHTGIGQVADLIRDGEYDEHDCVVIATRHRIAAENAALGEITTLRALIAEDQAQIAALTTYRENLRDEVIELRARIAELEQDRSQG